jgi:uncharacterized membrane protein
MDDNGDWAVRFFLAGLIIVPVVIAFALAFPLESKRRKKSPGTLPYKWGYYWGVYWICFWSGGFLSIFLFDLTKPWSIQDKILAVGFVGIGAALAAPGYFVVKRRKWAWVVTTILSMNVVCWVVNWLYAKHRWSELNP